MTPAIIGPRAAAVVEAGAGRVIGLGWSSGLALALTSLVGLAAFAWPLLAAPESGLAHSSDAPYLFVLLLALLVLVVLASIADGRADAKTVALLGVLAAVGAGLRVLGTGSAGVEPLFFFLVLVGRAYGAGFGFVLGNLAVLVSAVVTGGVGPWLPFQMLGAGWVAMGAGMLPRLVGRREVAMLAAYGAVAALVYGLLLDMWFWPFVVPPDASIAFVAGDPVIENLTRFLAYHLVTALGWDLPRAVLTAVLCLLAGSRVLGGLRRAYRRAAFDAEVRFVPAARPHREEVAR
jgi:energy-coupling factor transport system substrate-specific component